MMKKYAFLLSLLTLPLLVFSAEQEEKYIEASKNFADANEMRPDSENAYEILQTLRPEWSFSAVGTWSAFDSNTIETPNTSSSNKGLIGFGAEFEYLPKFLQGIGVFGIGPVFHSYKSEGKIESKTFKAYSFGGKISYQLRVMKNQWVVPFASYQMETLKYDLQNVIDGNLSTTGARIGGMFYLNSIAKEASTMAYFSSGLLRSYLTFEAGFFSGKDDKVNLKGTTLLAGFRIEL